MNYLLEYCEKISVIINDLINTFINHNHLQIFSMRRIFFDLKVRDFKCFLKYKKFLKTTSYKVESHQWNAKLYGLIKINGEKLRTNERGEINYDKPYM